LATCSTCSILIVTIFIVMERTIPGDVTERAADDPGDWIWSA
jgi:hypothetical protein